jgi:hypothetical protein
MIVLLFITIEPFIILQSQLVPFISSPDVNEHHLVRDEFNQRHFIIAATKSNKIYALDSQGGKVSS